MNAVVVGFSSGEFGGQSYSGMESLIRTGPMVRVLLLDFGISKLSIGYENER